MCVAKYSELKSLVPLILWWIFLCRRYSVYSQQSPSCEAKIELTRKEVVVVELVVVVVVVVSP